MGVTIIEYKNKKILYVDQRGAKSEEDILRTSQQGFKKHAEFAENVLAGALINYTGVDQVYSQAYINKLKEAPPGYGKEKIAIVGAGGVNKALTTGVDAVIRYSNTKLFDNEDEAKEWLVS